MPVTPYPCEVETQMKTLYEALNEKDRRRFMPRLKRPDLGAAATATSPRCSGAIGKPFAAGARN